jgi:hypothetical protein
MDPRAAIKLSIDSGEMIATSYLNDLTDKEMFHRPHRDCNHINWQVGHLIASEHEMIEAVRPGSMPPLPAGFAQKYANDKAKSDNPAQFCSKSELLTALQQQRAGTLAALDKCSAADLDRQSPESMQSYAPTVGAAFSLQGGHWLMHAGQWAVIRRQLGRPPLF